MTQKQAPARATSISHTRASEYAPRPVKYVDVNGHFPVFDGLFKDVERPRPLVLVGPKGVGKSLSLAAYAHKNDIPLITFDCSEDVRRSHLIGQFILRGEETPFILGPITTAFEVANEVGQAILILEECNALTPQMQKLLNGITDFRGRVEVPECERVFALKPGSKLWITGTMNMAVYGGVYAMNEDLKSRLRIITVEYPTPTQEKSIVTEALGADEVKKLGPKDIEQVLLLAHETRQKSLDFALSPRDVVALLEDFLSLGRERALRLVLGKFDGDDRSTVRERITSIFGVKFD